MYIHTCTVIYVDVHTYMYSHIYIYVDVHTYMYSHIYIYVDVHTYMYIHIYIYVDVHTYMYSHIYIYVDVHTVHTCTFICTHTNNNLYTMYIVESNIYIYTQTSLKLMFLTLLVLMN